MTSSFVARTISVFLCIALIFSTPAFGLAPSSSLNSEQRYAWVVRSLVAMLQKEKSGGAKDLRSISENAAAQISREQDMDVKVVSRGNPWGRLGDAYSFTVNGRPVILLAIRGIEDILPLEGGKKSEEEIMAVRLIALHSQDSGTRANAFHGLANDPQGRHRLLDWFMRHPNERKLFMHDNDFEIRQVALIWSEVLSLMQRLAQDAGPEGVHPRLLASSFRFLVRNETLREDAKAIAVSFSSPHLTALFETPATDDQSITLSDLDALYPEVRGGKMRRVTFLDDPHISEVLDAFITMDSDAKQRYSNEHIHDIFGLANTVLTLIKNGEAEILKIRRANPQSLDSQAQAQWAEVKKTMQDAVAAIRVDSAEHMQWIKLLEGEYFARDVAAYAIGIVGAGLAFILVSKAPVLVRFIAAGCTMAATVYSLTKIFNRISLPLKIHAFQSRIVDGNHRMKLLDAGVSFIASADPTTVEARKILLRRILLDANQTPGGSPFDALHRWYLCEDILQEQQKIEALRARSLPSRGSVLARIESSNYQWPETYQTAVAIFRESEEQCPADQRKAAQRFLRRQIAARHPWAMQLLKELTGMGKEVGDAAGALIRLGLSEDIARNTVERISSISRLWYGKPHDIEMVYAMMESDENILGIRPAGEAPEFLYDIKASPQGVSCISMGFLGIHKGVALVDPAKGKWPQLEPFGFDSGDPDHLAMALKGFWVNPVNNSGLDKWKTPPDALEYKLNTRPGRLQPVLENIVDPEFQQDYALDWVNRKAMAAYVGAGYPPHGPRELAAALNATVIGFDLGYPSKIFETMRPEWLRVLPDKPARIQVLFDKDTRVQHVLAGDENFQDVTSRVPEDLNAAMIRAARSAALGKPENPLDDWKSPEEKYGLPNLILSEGDMVELPAAKDDLDILLCFNVFEYHWSLERGAAMKDFALRLKEGGIALVGGGVNKEGAMRLSWTVYQKVQGKLIPKEIFFHPLAFLRMPDRSLNARTRGIRKEMLAGSLKATPEAMVWNLRQAGYPAEVRKGGIISLVLRPDGKAVNLTPLSLSGNLEWLEPTGSAA